MYAVIQNGSHQYRVIPGQFLRVQKIPLSPGKMWKCTQVPAFQDKAGRLMTGAPYLEKAQVHCRVVRHGKDKKQIVFKKNRRKGYRKTQGHRQEFTEIYVEHIHTPTGEQIRATAKKPAGGSSTPSAKNPADKKLANQKPANQNRADKKLANQNPTNKTPRAGQTKTDKPS